MEGVWAYLEEGARMPEAARARAADQGRAARAKNQKVRPGFSPARSARMGPA